MTVRNLVGFQETHVLRLRAQRDDLATLPCHLTQERGRIDVRESYPNGLRRTLFIGPSENPFVDAFGGTSGELVGRD